MANGMFRANRFYSIILFLITFFWVLTSPQGLAYANVELTQDVLSQENMRAELLSRKPQWDEVQNKRDKNSRIWQVTKWVERIDPVTNEPNVVEVTSKVVEKGCGICYADENKQWQVTDTSWKQTTTGFVMDKANYALEIGKTAGSLLKYCVDGEILNLKASKIKAQNNNNSTDIAHVNDLVQGYIDSNRPNVLVFTNAFGEGIDLEIEAKPDGFHQNVIFQNKLQLPMGFKPEDTEVQLYTELGLAEYLANARVDVKLRVDNNRGKKENDFIIDKATISSLTASQKTKGHIDFEIKEEGQQPFVSHRFVDSDILIAKEGKLRGKTKKIAQAEKQIVQEGSQGYLVESLEAAVLTDAESPIIWDYHTINTDITQNETWYADATYYVSSSISVTNNATLRIEPGTIVKGAYDTVIRIYSSEDVIIKGKPYEYIVFTSARDSSCGEIIDDSTPPDYDWWGIEAKKGTFEYCKFGYGIRGLYHDLSSSSDFVAVKNCIFYNCQYAYGAEFGGNVSLFNNLFLDCKYSVAPFAVGRNWQITNNTFLNRDAISNSCAVSLYGSYYGNDVLIKNNLFVNYDYGIKSWGPSFDEHHNAFSGCTTAIYNGTPSGTDKSPTYPCVSTSLGDQFLNDDAGGGVLLVGAGDNTVDTYYNDPCQWSIYPVSDAHLFTSSTTFTTDKVWQPNYNTCDTEMVDIGYHHPRVDYVVAAGSVYTSSGKVLTIQPGTIVSIGSIVGPYTRVNGVAGSIVAHGDPFDGGYISFINTKLAAAAFGTTSGYQYVSTTAPTSVCRFFGMSEGLISDSFVHDCIFKYNIYGADVSDIQNCIFTANAIGIINDIGANGEGGDIYVKNVTFDRNRCGILYDQGYFGGCDLYVTDSVFTNHLIEYSEMPANGICFVSNNSNIQESFNAFFKDYKHLTKWGDFDFFEDVDLDTTDFAGEPVDSYASVIDSSDFYSGWTDFDDRFYLSQDSSLVDAGDPNDGPMYGYTTDPNGIIVDTNRRDIGFHYLTNAQTDADGLYDYKEFWLGTDPNDVDSDNDGLVDGQSGVVLLANYPQGVSLDGIYVVGEATIATDPLDPDSDGDTINDGNEIRRGSNPTDNTPFSAVWKVDSTAATGGNGLEWSTAFKYLQDALNNPLLLTGDQIWVATGIYYPDEDRNSDTGDPNSVFLLVDGVPIYGGFSGVEQTLEERNFNQYETVLSGDIDGNDPNEGLPVGTNSYHVVTDANTLLDGFVITQGCAREGTSSGGGGLLCSNSSLEVRNCRFELNKAESNLPGAAICVESGELTLVNTLICGNFATSDLAGGIYNEGNVDLTNCTVVDNTGGGVICDGNGALAMIENSIFWHNRMQPDDNAYPIREVVLLNGGQAEIHYSDIEGGGSNVILDNSNQLTWDTNNISDDPQFELSGQWYWKLADGNELSDDPNNPSIIQIDDPNKIIVYDFVSGTAAMDKGIKGVEEDELAAEWLGYDASKFSSDRPTLIWDATNNKKTCSNDTDFYLWFTNNGTTGKGPKITLPISWDCVDAEKGIFAFNQESFFPLDGIGLDPNTNQYGIYHNWFFTFQLHTEITYVPGQMLFFKASDDLFVAIENRVVVDRGGYFNYLGGGTGPSRTTIVLKSGNIYVYEEPPTDPYDLAGRNPTVTITELNLQPFESYNFDLFFAQRASCDSVLVAGMTPGDIGMTPCFRRGDYRLPIWNSPCVETGDPAILADMNELDLSCAPRFQDADANDVARIDMGAYEYQPPVAVNDPNYFTRFNGSLEVLDPNEGMLANDYDPQGDPLVVEIIDDVPAAIGVLELIDANDGTFRFIPAQDSNTDATFTYRVHDIHGGPSNIAAVAIEVNDRPIAVGDDYVMRYNQAISDNVLTHGPTPDSDPDQDGIYASLIGSPSHGTDDFYLDADGAFYYEPNGIYVGTDSFTYKLIDEHGDESADIATVTIQVTNEPPVSILNVSPNSKRVAQKLDMAQFVFDGSGSGDLESDIAYYWTIDGQPINIAGTGGLYYLKYRDTAYTVSLTVEDECGASSSSSSLVQVTTNHPPQANAGQDSTYTNTDNTGSETVVLNGSGSSDPDNDALDYRWYKNNKLIATGQTPSVQLPIGTHTIKLIVKDAYGLTDSDEVTIIVKLPDMDSPEIDAGPNQEFTLPLLTNVPNIQLYGDVINGMFSGYHWQVISKPVGGWVNFNDPNVLAPEVTFSDKVEGTYVFRLEGYGAVNDDDITSVKINKRPFGNIGPQVVINAPSSFDPANVVLNSDKNIPEITVLSGVVTDDGLPFGKLTGTWRRIAGPAGVQFAAPQQSNTTDGRHLEMQIAVNFSQAGNYLLALEGDDGSLTDQAAISITVRSQLPPTVDAGENKIAYIIDPDTSVAVTMSDAKITDNEIPYGNVQSTIAWTVSEESTDPDAVDLNGQGSGIEKPTFIFNEVGRYKLVLTASDPNVSSTPEPNDSVWVQILEEGPPEDPDIKKIYAGGSKLSETDPNGAQVYTRTFPEDEVWTAISDPNEHVDAILTLCEYDTNLYAGSKGIAGGDVYRYDGDLVWTDVSDWSNVIDDDNPQGPTLSFEVSSVYSLVEYNGELYAGTDIDNILFRYEGGNQWTAIPVTSQSGGIRNLYVWKGKLFLDAGKTEEFGYYDSDAGWVVPEE